MARPGIMLYFDILEPIKVLHDADKGRLLVAMLEYGQCGIEPQFDGELGLTLAWGFVKPKLDRDGETYENAKAQRRYAAFCKRRTAIGLPKVPFEDWLNMTDDERERMITNDNEPLRAGNFVGNRYPTTTAPASTSTISTSMSTAAAAVTGTITEPEEFAAATAEKEMKFLGGELGKGVVLLSDIQIGSLIDQLGLDAFDFYVEKLANFICQNNACVKSHYDTILKWWKEDSEIKHDKK